MHTSCLSHKSCPRQGPPCAYTLRQGNNIYVSIGIQPCTRTTIQEPFSGSLMSERCACVQGNLAPPRVKSTVSTAMPCQHDSADTTSSVRYHLVGLQVRASQSVTQPHLPSTPKSMPTRQCWATHAAWLQGRYSPLLPYLTAAVHPRCCLAPHLWRPTLLNSLHGQLAPVRVRYPLAPSGTWTAHRETHARMPESPACSHKPEPPPGHHAAHSPTHHRML